jgi:DNA-binding XRE family transcriptional regulator
MSQTDKKRRKLAGAIGESFAAIRRRTARSAAWLSLSAPAMKIYVELRLRWRHENDNNGDLHLSILECWQLLRIPHATACRAYRELQDKGFIVMTRRGEAGRLSRAVLDNGGYAASRKATTWRLTDEPYRGQPATHDYERWQPDSDSEKKQFHGSAGGPATGPLVDQLTRNRSTSGTVGTQNQARNRSTGGPSLSTIYAQRGTVSPRNRESARGIDHDTRAAAQPNGQTKHTPQRTADPPKRRGGGRFGIRPLDSNASWPAAERIAAGMTQPQLAELAGIKREYLSVIERGRRQPSAAIRGRLQAALSVRQRARA